MDKIKARAPATANRTRSILGCFCTWSRKRGIIEVSPFMDIDMPALARSRDRVLADEELCAVWRACEAAGWPYGKWIQLLILTGQRRSEVSGMRWSEIDLPGKSWVLAKERCKNNTAHSVPLSRQAVEILESLPRLHPDFVFTCNGSQSITAYAWAKLVLEPDKSVRTH